MNRATADVAATDRVLLVTGGSRGIGAATVRAAARAGYAVGFSYLQDEAAAQALLAQLRAGGARALAVQGDVADPAFAPAFFDRVERELGTATALVNNAGITGRIAPFHEQSLEVLQRTFDVNVLGTLLTTQQALRRWYARGTPGRVVNVSSVAATLGSPGEYVHYAASKAAIDAFTVGLAKEAGPRGIRINAVAPGITDTEIHAAGGEPDRPARVVSRVPLGRIGTAEDMAASILWLLSDEASYVSGAVLRVGGGM
jgi:NAD(P)-dependent dehydrogenase (short-subunit alcohol dehydrogenase family)